MRAETGLSSTLFALSLNPLPYLPTAGVYSTVLYDGTGGMAKIASEIYQCFAGRKYSSYMVALPHPSFTWTVACSGYRMDWNTGH